MPLNRDRELDFPRSLAQEHDTALSALRERWISNTEIMLINSQIEKEREPLKNIEVHNFSEYISWRWRKKNNLLIVVIKVEMVIIMTDELVNSFNMFWPDSIGERERFKHQKRKKRCSERREMIKVYSRQSTACYTPSRTKNRALRFSES